MTINDLVAACIERGIELTIRGDVPAVVTVSLRKRSGDDLVVRLDQAIDKAAFSFEPVPITVAHIIERMFAQWDSQTKEPAHD